MKARHLATLAVCLSIVGCDKLEADDSSDDGMVGDGANDDDPEGTTEGETTGETSEGETTGETTGEAETGGGAQHPLCDAPAPDPLPALPQINTDALGDPLFAGWQALDCGALEVQTCSAHSDCEGSGRCLFGEVGGPGVCTQADVDVWCDGEGEAMNFLGFDCFVCSSTQAHAQACCEELPGFDCRIWPYPSDGPPNSVCARHEDCEPGLICGPHVGSGFGVCQCPDVDVDLPASCWE